MANQEDSRNICSVFSKKNVVTIALLKYVSQLKIMITLHGYTVWPDLPRFLVSQLPVVADMGSYFVLVRTPQHE